jgi:hypothetical protein
MIILAEDCLVFHNEAGEGFPFTAEKISVELLGDTASMFDAEFIKHVASAVLHYFRDELGRQSVTMAEFSMALEKVLRGFQLSTAAKSDSADPAPRMVQSDLNRLAVESDSGGELIFFPRLRDELRAQLECRPQLLCFQGIHECVKKLAGARRWSDRCQVLHDQIVEFLRSCMSRESAGAGCALVVR